MRLSPHSFNGFLFHQTNRVVGDWEEPYDWSIGGIATTNVPLSQRFPQYAAKSYAGSVKVVTITLNDVDADRDELVKAMDVLGEDEHQLIALDEFGRAWYVEATFIGLNEDSTEGKTASFGAIFAVADIIWKKLEPTEFDILNDGTGAATTTPLGNQPALPVITITPTAPGAGSPGPVFKKFIAIVNNSTKPLINYPLNLTGAGLDTAALIAAGDMLANGDDLRIFTGAGVEIPRWFGGGGINSTTTKIWINWNQVANANMTLGAAIAGTGPVSTITIQNTPANVATIKTIPNAGGILIGSEIFIYTGKNILTLQLTGVTRAERLSSEAAHSIGDTTKLIGGIWMYYGWPSSPAYVANDTNKPIIDLAQSTNVAHVYTEFLESTGQRTGKWDKRVISANPYVVYGKTYQSELYTISHGGGDADPAVVIGTLLAGPGDLGWKYYNPCGITHIATVGEKYSINVAVAFNCSLRAGVDGIAYPFVVYSEDSPTLITTWQPAGSGGTIALGSTYYYLYLRSYASPLEAASKIVRQLNELTSAVITVANPPTINTSAVNENFTLHSIMTNAATGLSMELKLAMKFDTYVVIDTKNKTVTLYDGTNAINMIIDMPVRAEWFPFLPDQENEITTVEDGEVTYAFAYEDRYL